MSTMLVDMGTLQGLQLFTHHGSLLYEIPADIGDQNAEMLLTTQDGK